MLLKRLLLTLGLALASGEAASQQVTPSFGLDPSGALRQLSVTDPSLTTSGDLRRTPLGVLDTSSHLFVPAATLQTLTAAPSFHPQFAPDYIRTLGYSTVGRGGALYQKVASMPLHAYKFFITDAAGAIVWYGIADSERPVNPEMLGAIGDDANDDKVALQSALGTVLPGTQIYPISGLGKTYRVSGWLLLRNGAILQDMNIVETLAGAQRPITSDCTGPGPTYPSCAGPFTLRRIKIDRGPSDSQTDSAGIWLAKTTAGLLLEDVEVFGGGAGTGVTINNFEGKVTLNRLSIHDMEWTNTTGVDPGIEQMQGLGLGPNPPGSSATVTDLQISRLWGTIPWVAGQDLVPSQGLPWRTNGGNTYRTTNGGVSGTTPPTCTGTPAVTTCSDGLKTWTYMGPAATTKRSYQTDGVGLHTVNNISFFGGTIRNGWDAIDIGHGENVWLYGVTYEDTEAWAEKWCHSTKNSGSIGSRSVRSGLSGFVVCTFIDTIIDPAGPSGPLRIIDATSIDSGYGGNWGATRPGFNTADGVGIQIINGTAVDDQAVSTMSYGFRSDSTVGGVGKATLINPTSTGHTSGIRTGSWAAVFEGVVSPTLNGLNIDRDLNVVGNVSSTGYLEYPRDNIPLVNGLNSNVVTHRTNQTISGPTADYSIGGFVVPVSAPDGVLLRIQNNQNVAMTIVNEDPSSTAANRIRTMSGANVSAPSGLSYAEFFYDGAISRWILIRLLPAAELVGDIVMNGSLTLYKEGGDTAFLMGSDAGYSASTELYTGELPRWAFGKDNVAESGGNAGSNFLIRAFTDAGALLDNVLTMSRSLKTATWVWPQLLKPAASAGAAIFPLRIQNFSDVAATEVGIDLAPNTNSLTRSAQITSKTTAGSDASLVFKTANGGAASEKMAIPAAGGVTVGTGVTAPMAGSVKTQFGFQAGVVAVASLPTCNAGLEGMMMGVNNSNTLVYNAIVAAGGSNHVPVYCNGTNWVLH